jgi:hypothetical protein
MVSPTELKLNSRMSISMATGDIKGVENVDGGLNGWMTVAGS